MGYRAKVICSTLCSAALAGLRAVGLGRDINDPISALWYFTVRCRAALQSKKANG